MVGIRTTALLLLMGALAGCVDVDEAGSPSEAADAGFAYADDRVQITSTNATNIGWVPTLEEPPQLVVGEYWKINMDFGLTGGSREAYVVVAGQETNHWLIGMPTHDFDNRIMVFHLPGMGQISKDTLGFEAHDVWFDSIQFPVEVGNTWTTGLMGNGNQQAEVTAVDGLTANIHMVGTYTIDIVYDASIRGIRSMNVAGYGSYEVLEHGFNWQDVEPSMDGLVTVPHQSDLILCHGRFAGGAEITGCALGQVDGPDESVEIDRTYDRVSFGLILRADPLINPVGASTPATYYQVTATAPDGTQYTETLQAGDTATNVLTPYKHDSPGGTWNVQAIAGGPGSAFAEGIGYHVYDVEIPSGRILASVGEHQHGSGEGH